LASQPFNIHHLFMPGRWLARSGAGDSPLARCIKPPISFMESMLLGFVCGLAGIVFAISVTPFIYSTASSSLSNFVWAGGLAAFCMIRLLMWSTRLSMQLKALSKGRLDQMLLTLLQNDEYFFAPLLTWIKNRRPFAACLFTAITMLVAYALYESDAPIGWAMDRFFCHLAFVAVFVGFAAQIQYALEWRWFVGREMSGWRLPISILLSIALGWQISAVSLLSARALPRGFPFRSVFIPYSHHEAGVLCAAFLAEFAGAIWLCYGLARETGRRALSVMIARSSARTARDAFEFPTLPGAEDMLAPKEWPEFARLMFTRKGRRRLKLRALPEIGSPGFLAVLLALGFCWGLILAREFHIGWDDASVAGLWLAVTDSVLLPGVIFGLAALAVCRIAYSNPRHGSAASAAREALSVCLCFAILTVMLQLALWSALNGKIFFKSFGPVATFSLILWFVRYYVGAIAGWAVYLSIGLVCWWFVRRLAQTKGGGLFVVLFAMAISTLTGWATVQKSSAAMEAMLWASKMVAQGGNAIYWPMFNVVWGVCTVLVYFGVMLLAALLIETVWPKVTGEIAEGDGVIPTETESV
jgi:hypothetical protein